MTDRVDPLGPFGFRRCYRRPTVRHAVANLRCDCLRVEIPVEAQAKGSGALATPHRGRPPIPIHQCTGRNTGTCGGTFTCEGCERLVGWCRGAGDELGEQHCDDCWADRRAVLERVAERRINTPKLLGQYDASDACIRPMPAVAAELRADGFIRLNGNGKYALTERGRAELGGQKPAENHAHRPIEKPPTFSKTVAKTPTKSRVPKHAGVQA